jgi:hypothetical protein
VADRDFAFTVLLASRVCVGGCMPTTAKHRCLFYSLLDPCSGTQRFRFLRNCMDRPFNISGHICTFGSTVMINSQKETPWTSSLYEMSTKQLGKGFLLCPPPHLSTAETVFVNLLRSPGSVPSLYKCGLRLLDRYLKTK